MPQRTGTTGTSDKVDGRRRNAARLAAVQALYQMSFEQGDVEDVIIEFRQHLPGAMLEADDFAAADWDFFSDIVRGCRRRQDEIDRYLDKAIAAGWTLQRMEKILAAVLRCGTYELLLRQDVPFRVIIAEYLDIAHAFFSGDEPSLVNGVLDNVARQLRAGEVQGPDGGPR